MSDDENVTQAERVPPHETTASPVEVSVAMPRYFGVTPPTLLFGVATATLAFAIMFAIFAHWVVALVLAATVLFQIAIFAGVARRKPDTVITKVSLTAIQRARERASWLVHATSVRTETGRALAPLRRELIELGERRERLLRDLGAAVYGNDDEAASNLTSELEALHEERERNEQEMRAIEEEAQERLHKAHLHVQPTVVKPPEESD